MRGDWVYRGEEFTLGGNADAQQVASYVGAFARNNGVYTLTPGNPIGLVLYDSTDYLSQMNRNIDASGATVTWFGKEARAEGKRATALGVDIHLEWMPSAWTVGSNWAVGIRLVICDQNIDTGGMDLPANYKMTGVNAGRNTTSAYANGWGNLLEEYRYAAFSTGNETVRWSYRAKWRGRRSLPPNACLGIYMESAGPAIGSTTLLVTPMCRSLIHDPNS